jgi:hypothetical protein
MTFCVPPITTSGAFGVAAAMVDEDALVDEDVLVDEDGEVAAAGRSKFWSRSWSGPVPALIRRSINRAIPFCVVLSSLILLANGRFWSADILHHSFHIIWVATVSNGRSYVCKASFSTFRLHVPYKRVGGDGCAVFWRIHIQVGIFYRLIKFKFPKDIINFYTA